MGKVITALLLAAGLFSLPVLAACPDRPAGCSMADCSDVGDPVQRSQRLQAHASCLEQQNGTDSSGDNGYTNGSGTTSVETLPSGAQQIVASCNRDLFNCDLTCSTAACRLACVAQYPGCGYPRAGNP